MTDDDVLHVCIIRVGIVLAAMFRFMASGYRRMHGDRPWYKPCPVCLFLVVVALALVPVIVLVQH